MLVSSATAVKAKGPKGQQTAGRSRGLEDRSFIRPIPEKPCNTTYAGLRAGVCPPATAETSGRRRRPKLHRFPS
ncbi:hypothetical protein DAI22_10g163201 [Oryza sativa Japonica Group]|nr:hypothetical protein DAI22_10g163201 [Oryza sativa Japonica Group]